MSVDPRCPREVDAWQTLSKQRIDEKLQEVIVEVAAPLARAHAKTLPDGSLCPRWIRPADLVRRMKRFLVYN